MSKEEAIRLIILNYCQTHNITPTEFARNSKISKSYISKILKKQFGKVGISMTYTELIAKGMKINMIEFQKLIELYKTKDENDIQSKEIIIAEINSEIRNLEKEDLKLLHSCLVNINTERLNILHSILENMK